MHAHTHTHTHIFMVLSDIPGKPGSSKLIVNFDPLTILISMI